MNKQDLIKEAMRLLSDGGNYAAVGYDGKMLRRQTFTGFFYARRYVSDCSVWVVVNDYEVIDQSEDANPYTDYDGGEPQYRADLATLDAAAKYVTGGWYEDGSLFYSQEIQASALDVASAWARMSAYLRGKGVL